MVHTSATIRGTASKTLAGRTIVLGVAGSIAAVKTVELARELIRHGAEVLPVMTGAAARIIHPDALHFATGNPPVLALTGAVEHVAAFGPGGDADLLLIAPATANTIAKLALGIDDTALTTYASVALGAGDPVVVAPAMHAPMEDNPPTKRHIEDLKARGVRFVRPRHHEGKAKLAPIDEIVRTVQRALGPRTMEGRRVLVVTGAGSEPVDPVRVLTNRSSGRMGQAVVQAAYARGADVTVLTSDPEIGFGGAVSVETFSGVGSILEWAEAHRSSAFDWVFCPAALSDYAPAVAPEKMPSDKEMLTLDLRRLPKVLPGLQRAWPDARVVGWKLDDTMEVAEAKARDRLAQHGVHAMVANATRTLGEDVVQARLVRAEGAVSLEGTKEEVAGMLLDALVGDVVGSKRKTETREA